MMKLRLVPPEALLDIDKLATIAPGFGVGPVVASEELSAGDVPALALPRRPSDA